MNFLDFLPEPLIVRIVRGGDGLEGLGQILGLVEQAGKVPLRRLAPSGSKISLRTAALAPRPRRPRR